MPKPDVSTERKAQILAAASNIFLKKGFDAARMEEIAASAGLSIGGVYWYYKSKEEVILDLMDCHHQHRPRRSARAAGRAPGRWSSG